MQESLEAAQRADVHNPDKLAAAGTTTTGQTSAERMEGMKQHRDPEVRGCSTANCCAAISSGWDDLWVCVHPTVPAHLPF